MKKLFTLSALLFAGTAFAQTENVGIGTTQPDKSAILDLSSSNKGFLLPRMTENARKSIVKPAQGLQVYQTDGTTGVYVFNGKDWENSAKSVAAAIDPWLRGGNAIEPGEFIGTTNFQPLILRAGGNIVATFRPELSGSLFIGRLAGVANSGIYNVGIGVGALNKNVGGTYNMALGTSALENNISGQYNSAVGIDALYGSTGSFNVGIGSQSGTNLTGGDNNVAIGYQALKGSSGGSRSNNVAIGTSALLSNVTGSGNVAIGHNAGQSETGSNLLYISNSNDTKPLIKGDFQNNNLQINSKTTGYLAIGDFTTATSSSPGTGGLPLPSNIGLANGYRLVVQDGILCEKVKVALRATGSSDWADYVFEPEYISKMLSLEQIEKYIEENKHLPNVPTTAEVQKNGLDMHQTSKMLLEKIEELTLYIIQLNNKIKDLESNK